MQLVQQAGVLDRNDRLVGEGREQRDLVAREAAGFATGHRDRSDRPVVAEHRHRNPASVAAAPSVGARGFWPSGIGVGVGDIERRSFANGLGVPRGHLVPLARLRQFRLECLREECPRGSVASVVAARERGEDDLIASDPGHHARVPPQQADGTSQNRVEHRLDIRLRLADDAQDVAGRGLRVQRRSQLAVARLELGEEAHVLDGNHGLVGEGLQEPDLGVREWPHFSPANHDRADRCSFA